MNKQKSVTRFLLAIAALIALIGIGQPVAAKSRIYRLQAGETISLGMQGLHVTNLPHGVSQVYLNAVGTGVPVRISHKADLKFRYPALEVHFLDAKGGEMESINALVYVYFAIGKAERDLWQKGGMDEIAIWHTGWKGGSWERCSTFFVNEPGGNGTVGRLACLARGSDYYALEREVFEKQAPSESPTPPLTSTPWPPPYPAWEPETTPENPG